MQFGEKLLRRFYALSQKQQDLILLTVVCLLSQGMLPFVTGKWGDDWCQYWDAEILQKVFMMTGLGLPVIWIKKMGYFFPGNGYLVIVFLLYYIAAISFYEILQQIKELPREDCFWLVVFFIVMPVNDARVMSICFPYAVGYGAFYLAFALLTKYFAIKNVKRKCVIRVLSLGLFFISFVLNSLLVFFLLPLIYVFYKEKGKREIKTLFHYGDFILLPILFWGIKTVFWPPSGIYASYYAITFLQMIKSIFLSVPASIMVVWEMLRQVIPEVIIIIIFTFGMYELYQKIVKKEYWAEQLKKNTVLVLIGFLLIGIGQYPYLVVGHGFHFHVDGFVGRDTILSPLGAALVCYYAIRLFPIREEFQKVMCFVFMLASIVIMNQRYFAYQQWGYQQMALREHMRDNQAILEGTNFLFMHSENDSREWSRFWVLNGIAHEAFGDEKRLFLRPEELHSGWVLPQNAFELMDRMYHLGDYDCQNPELDGIIIYQHPEELKKVPMVLELKFYELFNEKEFRRKLRSLGHIDYIPAGGPIVNDGEMRTLWSK